jgi:hypothetical protein
MSEAENKITLTPTQFAHLGEGIVAYMRQIDSDDLKDKFPGLPEIESGLRLWALFAANGQPIMLTDEPSSAVASAMQHDLTPVSIH